MTEPLIAQMKGMVRLLGRNRIFPRRFDGDLGGAHFYGSIEGGLKYLRPRVSDIDPDLTNFARMYVRPGSQVWDVGANIGLFTFAAAGLAGSAGRVLAVEPDVWAVEVLRKASRKNSAQVAVVDVVPAAIASEQGVASFFIANQCRATNALTGHGNSTTGGFRERQWVPTMTLDSLLVKFRAPDVLKIDVEDAELELLYGAEDILQRVRPAILIEVAPRNQRSVSMLLSNAGYQLFDAENGTEIDIASFLTVALPRDYRHPDVNKN